MIEEASCRFIGTISKPVGNKGSLQIKTAENTNTDLLFETESVFFLLNGLLVPFILEEIEVLSKSVIVKVEGIDTVEQALKYKEVKVYVPIVFTETQDEVDQSFQHDIMGYKVVDVHSGLLGDVCNVNLIPENPLLEVNYKSKIILIPAHDDFIENIDDVRKIIYVKLPDGFLEIF